MKVFTSGISQQERRFWERLDIFLMQKTSKLTVSVQFSDWRQLNVR